MAALRRTLLLLCSLGLAAFLCACGGAVKPSSAAPYHTLPVVSSAKLDTAADPAPSGTSSDPAALRPTSTETASAARETTTAVSSAAVQTDSPASVSESGETTETEETEESTPSAEASSETLPYKEIAALYLAGMDERAKLFQLMIVTPEAICWDNPVMVPDNQELSSKPVAGLLYQAKNMESRQQLLKLVEGHQEAAPLPLFICVDEEGGRVSRIMQTMGTTPIKNMFTYRGDGPEKARKNALTLAQDIRSFGFNVDFAPVTDVWSNPENRVIGERAYSDDFNKASLLIASAVNGFHQGGVICTLKHFPGHGDTLEDSHDHAALVQKSLEQLRKEEFLPFAAGIKAGADMVMTGHLMVPDIDPDNLATFSHKIVTDILREEMGFEGVIITDALEMGAATSVSTGGEACLKALLAGNDLLLCPAGQPENLTACVDYLLEAIQNSQLSWERVDESLLRILELKLRYGILEAEAEVVPETSSAPAD